MPAPAGGGAPGVVPGRLDDGRVVSFTLRRVRAEPGELAATPSWARAGWLPRPVRWRTEPAQGEASPGATGVLLADLPPDAVGQGVWIDGLGRVALRWIAPADEAIVRAIARAARTGLPELGAAGVWEIADAQSRDPLRRWRGRLLGLIAGVPIDDDRFEDPVLEAIAVTREERVRSMLVKLHEADAALASRVLRRLVAVAEFGPGVLAPVWSEREGADQEMLDAVLDPAASSPQRLQAARVWLDSQPLARGWVISDAATQDAAGRVVSTLGVMNLSGLPLTISARSIDAAEQLVVLEPLRTSLLRVEGRTAIGHLARAPQVTLAASLWSEAHGVLAWPAEVRPPGLPLAPLRGDLDLSVWLAGPAGAGAVPVDDRVALVLARDVRAGGEWVVYAEIKSPADVEETLRIWLGREGVSGAVLRVLSSGRSPEIARESTTTAGELSGQGQPIAGARITRGSDRWFCRIPVPPEAITPEGIIFIGVDRLDASGRHFAYPRPMMPWQSVPGRVAIDTKSWPLTPSAASPPPGAE